MKKTIYLASGLFNAGERLHNLYLEKHLKTHGRKVILPQREALRFFKKERFDINGIVADCQKHCTNPKNIYVGNSDGADSDSGTAVEYGIAITTNGKALVYRTDYRTAIEKEVGINAMLRAKGTTFVYHPCFFTELDQVDIYYAELAQMIDKALITMKC